MNKKILIIVVSILAIVLVGIGAYVYYQINLAPPSAAQIEKQKEAFAEASDSGNLDSAISIAEQMAAKQPDSSEALLIQAYAYLDKGTLEFQEEKYANMAIEIINKVIVKDPSNAEAYKTLGYAFEIKQDYAHAIPAYNKAISIDNQNAYFYTRRGHAYDLMGKMDLAKADYDKAFSIDPTDASTLLNLARYYYSTHDASSTISFAERAAKTGTKARLISSAYGLIGLSYMDMQNFEKAKAAIDMEISSDPTSYIGYLDRSYFKYLVNTQADGKLTTGEAQEINVDINKGLSLYPTSADAYYQKGDVADAVGDDSGAKTNYQKALSLVDGDISLTATDKADYKNELVTALKKYE